MKIENDLSLSLSLSLSLNFDTSQKTSSVSVSQNLLHSIFSESKFSNKEFASLLFTVDKQKDLLNKAKIHLCKHLILFAIFRYFFLQHC